MGNHPPSQYPVTLSTENLHELLPRVLHFRLRLMHFTFNIPQVPGKNLVTVDDLSHAPKPVANNQGQILQSEVAGFIAAVSKSLPVTDRRLSEIKNHQSEDEFCCPTQYVSFQGLANKHELPDCSSLFGVIEVRSASTRMA